MQITTKLLDSAIQGNNYCTSLFIKRLCYYCHLTDEQEMPAKYYFLYKKQYKSENSIIISFCSKECQEHISLGKYIELYEKDLFYIRLHANNY